VIVGAICGSLPPRWLSTACSRTPAHGYDERDVCGPSAEGAAVLAIFVHAAGVDEPVLRRNAD